MAKWFSRTKPSEGVCPTHLIVGLGNPGPEYLHTRHNIGFLVIDFLAASQKITLKTRKHQALYGLGTLEGLPVLLVKPMTYMNRSGEAVAALARQHHITPSNILVISDDIALELGKIRLRAKGSAGGHNGHRSIIQSLKTEQYPRLRIGIGKPNGEEVADFVLSDFSYHEKTLVDQTIQLAADASRVFLKEGVDQAMNLINQR
jgi:PTH1 family peptidyl-tRNA hydrolase